MLDALAARGASGVHVPFGRGVATSSEVSHWSILGFEDLPFPGRAALEALGAGLRPPVGVPLFHLALRQGTPREGAVWLGARARPSDDADAAALFAALGEREVDGIRFELRPIRVGESVLLSHGAPSHEVSHSDALFPRLHPWMQPCPVAEAAAPDAAGRTAAALQAWLLRSHDVLADHPVNRRRQDEGLPRLDVPVTKRAGVLRDDAPTFEQQVGLREAAVTSSGLYRGLAMLLGLECVDRPGRAGDEERDLAARVTLGRGLLARTEFVHLHTKAPDEAGHAKDPEHKRDVLERLDAGMKGLLQLTDRAVVAVTGDHATPSTSPLLHSGDPTPFVLAGPGVRPDGVRAFGEAHASTGALGGLRARDVMPLLSGSANRPFFRGHRPGPWRSQAMPAAPTAMQPAPTARRSDD